MPTYGVAQSGSNAAPNEGLNLTSLIPGDQPFFLWNAETLVPGTASVAFSRGPGPTLVPAPIVFTISFASAPTSVIEIQGSNQDIAATYQTLYTSTSLQYDVYADQGGFAYYRAYPVSQSGGGAATCIAKR